MTDLPPFPDPPTPGLGDDFLHAQLLDQRRIMLAGPIDGASAVRLTGQLLVVDGAGDEPVDLVVNSPGGPLGEIFGVVDLIAAMRSTVNVACIGSASGTAVALVAGATGERRAARHARFSLRLAREATPDGADVVRHAEQRKSLEQRYVELLAAATRLEPARIDAELSGGEDLSATEAVELGIVDALLG